MVPGRRDYITIHRSLHLLDIPDIERRIIGFLVSCQHYVWTNLEASSLPTGVALELDASETSVKRGLASLHRRGWIYRGVDGRGHLYAQLTDEVTRVCRVALEQQQIRRWVGAIQWRAHVNRQADMAEFCNLLRSEALQMGSKRLRDDVRVVSNAIFRTYSGLRRNPWNPVVTADRIGPTIGPNRSGKRTKSVRPNAHLPGEMQERPAT